MSLRGMGVLGFLNQYPRNAFELFPILLYYTLSTLFTLLLFTNLLKGTHAILVLH